MQYYYQIHIRNLQQQSFLEKQKISAQLHEDNLLQRKCGERLQKSRETFLRKSRRDEDRENAAYLERSRLEAELSATRIKAENTMNRSRLQSAFQLRKENQKAVQELQRMNLKHQRMQQQAVKQQIMAHQAFEQTQRQLEYRLRNEDYLVESARNQRLLLNTELDKAYMQSIQANQMYYSYY